MSAPVSASAICPCLHALVSHRIRASETLTAVGIGVKYGLVLYCRACASECTNATVDAVAAFANFCDVGRLYELEFAGKMPKGSANKFVRCGAAYLIRIVQLEQKFRDGSYPGPTITGVQIMSADREMPKYKCHKEVWALKIAKIVRDGEGDPNRETDGSAMITPVESGYAPFRVDSEFMRRNKMEVGGYFVVYKDGYKSYSPAKAFEEGYTIQDRK